MFVAELSVWSSYKIRKWFFTLYCFKTARICKISTALLQISSDVAYQAIESLKRRTVLGLHLKLKTCF